MLGLSMEFWLSVLLFAMHLFNERRIRNLEKEIYDE